MLVLVLVVGAFGYKTMTKKPVALDKGPVAVTGGPTLEETSLTVNLRDGHYLEFTAALQVAHGKSAKSLDNIAPRSWTSSTRRPRPRPRRSCWSPEGWRH